MAHLETVCMSASALLCHCVGFRLPSCSMLQPFMSPWHALCTLPLSVKQEVHVWAIELMLSTALNGHAWPFERSQLDFSRQAVHGHRSE